MYAQHLSVCNQHHVILHALPGVHCATRFPAHDELGMCRTSLVSLKQSVVIILVWPSDAAFMTVT